MEEDRIDNELKRIYEKLPFLWEDYGFHVKYLTKDHGMYHQGFLIGLENKVCKMVFEKESNSQFDPIIKRVGTESALFTPPNSSYFAEYGWYYLTGILKFISGVEYEHVKDVDKDLKNISGYLKLHMDKVLELFKFPDEIDSKLEYYRNLHKEEQITVEKIREERARLKALGQGWSLEAAITSLRGGKK